ncbi:MAG: nitrile hydratase subunit beta [Gammaproteobacteria bacterium]|nr:nitrile hydratase subunit beta [Gammaproteobacteria bacterium]MDD9871208.1 nitrile hydratase subunit beta [Gammaproteobacteria bacterium]
MIGPHDCGGRRGEGAVRAEKNEPVFHHRWERRVFALTLAMGFHGRWNLDMSRHARERMPGYRAASYYAIWLHGLETLLAECKVLAQAGELHAPSAAEVAAVIAAGASARAAADQAAAFTAGDAVRVKHVDTAGHTRAPRYLHGRRGVVARDCGVFVFPDSNAHGRGADPQHVYSVRFSAGELWGGENGGRDFVYADLFENHLTAEAKNDG